MRSFVVSLSSGWLPIATLMYPFPLFRIIVLRFDSSTFWVLKYKRMFLVCSAFWCLVAHNRIHKMWIVFESRHCINSRKSYGDRLRRANSEKELFIINRPHALQWAIIRDAEYYIHRGRVPLAPQFQISGLETISMSRRFLQKALDARLDLCVHGVTSRTVTH